MFESIIDRLFRVSIVISMLLSYTTIEVGSQKQIVESYNMISESIFIEKRYTELETNMEIIYIQEPLIEKEKQYKSLGMYKITAYCNCKTCCGKWANGPTSIGVMPKEGVTIAVDPNIIPYGSEIKFDDKTYIAQDCGGAIKNNRIDLYFEKHEDALKYGVKYLETFIEIKEE